jgi:hypothetical protein
MDNLVRSLFCSDCRVLAHGLYSQLGGSHLVACRRLDMTQCPRLAATPRLPAVDVRLDEMLFMLCLICSARMFGHYPLTLY